MSTSRSITESKFIIDALKNKPQSKKELIDTLIKRSTMSFEAARKKCERDLNKLNLLGLTEQIEDKYFWYIYANLFEGFEDYSTKLLHSEQLIPALQENAAFVPDRFQSRKETEHLSDDMKELMKYADEHLKAYRDLWVLSENYKNASEKARSQNKEFTENMEKKLRKEFGKAVGEKGESFVASNIPVNIQNLIREDAPLTFRSEGQKLWLGSGVVASGRNLHNKVMNFIEHETNDEFNIDTVNHIKELEQAAWKCFQPFQEKMRKLILKIKAGEPLLGKCEVCPRVYIKTEVATKK